jgi:F0F1-type ATP synthase delta subunit
VSGANDVSLENKIDPKVIGGVRISFGDEIIDLTVKNKLKQLAQKLTK